MTNPLLIPGVTYSMPTAAERLRAEETSLMQCPAELALIIMSQADALIEVAVANGPRDCDCGFRCENSHWDPLDVEWRGSEIAKDYLRAARALGIA